MIELEKRPIEWLYYKIKTMDDYDMRKLLSEELLKREVNNEIIDDEAYRIALSFQNFETLYNLRNSPNASDYAAYDDRINRAKRIKFDLIRTIRSNKLPKEVTKDLLNQLDVLDTIINVASKDKTVGLMDKFSNFFRFNGATIKELESIDKVTESLMENDLHALTAKLKIIKGL